jgi:hypothetical protein
MECLSAITGIPIVGFGMSIAYTVGAKTRAQRSPLELRYDRSNPQHVETIPKLYESSVGSSRYYVEIYNQSSDRTISDVEVDWDQTPFTSFIDQECRRKGLLDPTSIHPKQAVRIFLFGLSDKILETPNDSDVLGHSSFFTVRAHGKDAAEITMKCEFTPNTFPKLSRLW